MADKGTSRPRFSAGFIAVGVWLWFSAGAAPVYMLAALALAGGVAWGFQRMLPQTCEARPAGLRALRRRIAALLLFAPLFAWIVLRAGLHITRLVLSPSQDFWPGIVRVKGGLRHRTATTLFAHLITLTPGTLTLDYDDTSDDLYIHWIDVAEEAGDDIDRAVTSGMRTWLERLFA